MPVLLEYVFQFQKADNLQVPHASQPDQPMFFWKPEKQELYLQNLCTNLENISERFNNSVSNNDCETSLKILSEAINKAAVCMKAHKRQDNNKDSLDKPKKTWFDKDCERLRLSAIRALRHFRYVKTEEALNNYTVAKQEYREQKCIFRTTECPFSECSCRQKLEKFLEYAQITKKTASTRYNS